MWDYDKMVLRNAGYVSDEAQSKISKVTLLIAGCGIGSTIAEAAVRLGFRKFVLVDGDQVEIHNLNRQAYDSAHVGFNKVKSLSARLKEINPLAEVFEVPTWITDANVADLVDQSDFVLDTVDFLDIQAITALHDESHRQKKPVISAVSAGWGAGAFYFPPTDRPHCLFREIFDLPPEQSVHNESYTLKFAAFIQAIKPHLDPTVVAAMAKALTIMEDGTPCPAPHVSAGSYAVASLTTTMLVRLLSGQFVPAAPRLILLDLLGLLDQGGIDLTVNLKAS